MVASTVCPLCHMTVIPSAACLPFTPTLQYPCKTMYSPFKFRKKRSVVRVNTHQCYTTSASQTN